MTSISDELRVYRGEDFRISKHIHIHQPTLGEICDYGEDKYYSMINMLTATPQTLKAQLWDAHIDYTTITPYQLFYNMIYRIFSLESTSIIFGDLDFSKFEIYQNQDGAIVLSQKITYIEDDREAVDDIIIDEFTYTLITDYLREIHDIAKDEKTPANESTKMILIEDAQDELRKSQSREHHSQLKNLISSMVNSEGFKYNHTQVWDMKINAFMDSVKRISRIKNAHLLLQSGYSGFGINLKDVEHKQLNWLGELD